MAGGSAPAKQAFGVQALACAFRKQQLEGSTMTIPMLYARISNDFVQVAAIAGVSIRLSDIEVQFIASPHRPPSSLPPGKLAVYVFMFADRCLKVGKAGSKSAARFCSHHYGASRAPSTLAKSLVKNQAIIGVNGLDDTNVKSWICEHTSQVNFLIPSEYGVFVLSLLEAFVQCCLQPEFEGFGSQRVPGVNTLD
jgi:hypothetical protein